MSDLQEIRRFWPKATWWGANMHAATNWLRGLLWIERVKVGLHRVVYVPENWGRKDFDGPTIAAAMAAAGFGERKPGPFAERRRQWLAKDPSVHWLHTRRLCEFGPCVCGVQLQSRQRPRKRVRLGKRGRRLALAASMGEALGATKHWRQMPDRGGWHDAMLGPLAKEWERLDRGEIGQ